MDIFYGCLTPTITRPPNPTAAEGSLLGAALVNGDVIQLIVHLIAYLGCLAECVGPVTKDQK